MVDELAVFVAVLHFNDLPVSFLRNRDALPVAFTMPGRISAGHWVPLDVHVAVLGLAPYPRHHRIGADEAAQGGSLILTGPFGLGRLEIVAS